jgi:hypothetical protein
VYVCGERHTSCESYYQCHCAKITKHADKCFYLGTMLLVTTGVFLSLARFKFWFENWAAAAIFSTVLFGGMVSLLFFHRHFPIRTRLSETLFGGATAGMRTVRSEFQLRAGGVITTPTGKIDMRPSDHPEFHMPIEQLVRSHIQSCRTHLKDELRDGPFASSGANNNNNNNINNNNDSNNNNINNNGLDDFELAASSLSSPSSPALRQPVRRGASLRRAAGDGAGSSGLPPLARKPHPLANHHSLPSIHEAEDEREALPGQLPSSLRDSGAVVERSHSSSDTKDGGRGGDHHQPRDAAAAAAAAAAGAGAVAGAAAAGSSLAAQLDESGREPLAPTTMSPGDHVTRGGAGGAAARRRRPEQLNQSQAAQQPHAGATGSPAEPHNQQQRYRGRSVAYYDDESRRMVAESQHLAMRAVLGGRDSAGNGNGNGNGNGGYGDEHDDALVSTGGGGGGGGGPGSPRIEFSPDVINNAAAAIGSPLSDIRAREDLDNLIDQHVDDVEYSASEWTNDER